MLSAATEEATGTLLAQHLRVPVQEDTWIVLAWQTLSRASRVDTFVAFNPPALSGGGFANTNWFSMREHLAEMIHLSRFPSGRRAILLQEAIAGRTIRIECSMSPFLGNVERDLRKGFGLVVDQRAMGRLAELAGDSVRETNRAEGPQGTRDDNASRYSSRRIGEVTTRRHVAPRGVRLLEREKL